MSASHQQPFIAEAVILYIFDTDFQPIYKPL